MLRVFLLRMFLTGTSCQLFLTKCLPTQNADFFFCFVLFAFVFPSYDCNKFQKHCNSTASEGFLAQMWEPV